MRLGVVVEQLLAPVPGGTGRYTQEISRAVAARLLAAGSPRPLGFTAWHRDVVVAEVPGVAGPYRLPLGRRALAAAWERGVGPGPGRGVDVVHAPTLLVPPRGSRPLVVTIHDAVPWTHPETLTPRGVAFHRRMAARVVREADVVVTVSQAAAAELRDALALGDRLRVIGHGVSADLAVPWDAASRARRLGLPDEGWLVTVATLEPRKGLDVALAALAQPGMPYLPLAVVGRPGWGGVDLPAAAARAGLPPSRLRVLGALDDADLAAVLGRARALLAPSRAEGFGLPVLEAMALGVPVVTSDAPALVELCAGAAEHAPVGDVAEFAEAVRRALGDDAHREALVARARRRAAEFTWERAAEQTVAAYADALR